MYLLGIQDPSTYFNLNLGGKVGFTKIMKRTENYSGQIILTRTFPKSWNLCV